MKFPLIAAAGLALFPIPSSVGQEAKPDAEPAAEAESAPKKAPRKLSATETAAVDAYKKEMLAIQKWLTGARDSAREQEAAAHRIPVQLTAKLEKVPVKGLPENLAVAFKALKANFAAQAVQLKDMPADDAKAMAWLADRFDDAKFNAAIIELQDAQAKAEEQLLAAGIDCGAGIESDLFLTSELAQWKEHWVVILGAYKNFEEAKTDGVKVAKTSKIPFSMRGMVYDKKGLHLPEDFDDEVYAGQYVLRQSNFTSEDGKDLENHISVEKSSDYEGFAPDYYITVGYIAQTAEEAEKKAAEFKKLAPGTYVKKTKLFMGCDR